MKQLQRTSEWFNDRLFRFTSSELDKLLSEPKSKASKDAGELSESSKEYVYDKISEYITNGTILDYRELNTKEVKWGEQYEDEARTVYECVTGNQVDLCGFIPYNDYFGGSPDGLVGSDGMIEIKCPYEGRIFVKYLLLEKPDDLKKLKRVYYTQIQGNLLATGRKWCDFVAYDPRVQNKDLAINILRIDRDDSYIAECVEQLEKANNYMNTVKKRLINKIINGKN